MGRPTIRDERALVERCLGGDEAACEDLVAAYASMVGTIVWRTTRDVGSVEDLAQETFLRVFRGLGDFAGRAKLSTWICQVAHRVAIDHLRKTRRSPPQAVGDGHAIGTGSLDQLPDDRAAGPEAAAAREEMDQIVRECLVQLEDKYRLPLTYAAIDGVDYATIGEMLDMPIGTVKTLIFRAKERLKELVQGAMERRIGKWGNGVIG